MKDYKDKIAVLEQAMEEDLTIEIVYEKYGGEPSIRSISNIRYSDEYGDDYISAFCHLRGDNRTFKIDRILKINGVSYDNTNITTSIGRVIQVHKSDFSHKPTTAPISQRAQLPNKQIAKNSSTINSSTSQYKSSGCMVVIVLITIISFYFGIFSNSKKKYNSNIEQTDNNNGDSGDRLHYDCDNRTYQILVNHSSINF